MSARFVEHRYRSADGRLRLFARDYRGERADAPPLLLMHGLTRNSADFEPLVPHISGRYRLIVPDQRGRGLSDDDPDPAKYQPGLYAADMLALLDGLGIARAAMIGTSMGGLVAMVMTAMQPERTAALVLNDIGAAIEPSGLDRIAGYVGGGSAASDWSEAAARMAAINGDAFVGFGEDDWLAFARRTCRTRDDGTIVPAYDPAIAAAFADGTGTDSDALWRLWAIMAAIPALVVRGAHSDLLSRETVAAMEERHKGPFAAVEVPGRGHAPLLDEPAAVAAIDAFLAAHWPA